MAFKVGVWCNIFDYDEELWPLGRSMYDIRTAEHTGLDTDGRADHGVCNVSILFMVIYIIYISFD